MRTFNTSGPNRPEKHYTLQRSELIKKGIELVENERYFTIWAPRQTGKSTYFQQLAEKLKTQGYKVAQVSFENYKKEPVSSFLSRLTWKLESFGDDYSNKTIAEVFETIEKNNKQKCVLIVDEVEGINPEYFGDFLHAIRNAYHSRHAHCLKSVILVGVSNIVGVVSDNASPFNIADNMNVPYFTAEEVHALLGQHETETGQLFHQQVKEKIFQITAGQPGLVNGFAYKLVSDFPEKEALEIADYLEVEEWYQTEAIDKNVANILNKASEYRRFLEQLLFTEAKISFRINRPAIKHLHTNGLIKKGEDGFVTFWVPLYKKIAHDAFYPYTNGEKSEISRLFYAPDYFTESGELKLDKLITTYKDYAKRRGFKVFMEKDENGNYKSIKEAALIYSFETFIHATVQELKGKMYREAHTGLGRSDLIINIKGNELLIEAKVYYSPGRFLEGKNQLAYYCRSLSQKQGIYLVFCPEGIPYPEVVKEQTETIEGVEIITYLVPYDEETW